MITLYSAGGAAELAKSPATAIAIEILFFMAPPPQERRSCTINPTGATSIGGRMKIAVVAPSCTLKRDAAEAVQAIVRERGDCELAIHPQSFLTDGHFA